MSFNKLSLREKLLAKVVRDGECLVWQGHRSRYGYGRIRIDGKWRPAHVVHYELERGPVLEGKQLMHSCDNRACIALVHLKPGTARENTQDMMQKGRHRPVRGEDHGRSKLTAEDVADIRLRYTPRSRTNGAHALAREYGVSRPVVCSIVKREIWKHVA